ncbi:MAG TPA: hypothetical protein VN151_04240, partial [Terracidiphilus sp.]|nr:hypothetical protein [Terracidiphilus sp.]
MRHAGGPAPQDRAQQALAIGKLVIVAALAAASAVVGVAQASPLTTLRALRQLTNDQARAGLPVDVQGTVTFARSSNHMLFVQEGDSAVAVEWSGSAVSAGDRVEVKGATQASFTP